LKNSTLQVKGTRRYTKKPKILKKHKE
jgi:hypothetical protein